jgi:hypothetical protein
VDSSYYVGTAGTVSADTIRKIYRRTEIKMKTAYKFRMYPNKQQEAMLDLTLETCRHLYNTALADRKNSYELEDIRRTYEDQAAILTVEKKDNPYLSTMYANCLQDVLRRLDKSFKASSGESRLERTLAILDSRAKVGTSLLHILMLVLATSWKAQR